MERPVQLDAHARWHAGDVHVGDRAAHPNKAAVSPALRERQRHAITNDVGRGAGHRDHLLADHSVPEWYPHTAPATRPRAYDTADNGLDVRRGHPSLG